MTEEFEKWARGDGFSLLKRDDGEYRYVDTKWALIGWQASRKQALEEAAELCDTQGDRGGDNGYSCAAAIRALQQQ